MADPRLQDALMKEFQEEKKMIQNQIDLFEPLAASLRKPAAQRLAQNGLILFGELFCWLFVLASIGTCIFLNKLYPFYVLFEISKPADLDVLGHQNLQMLRWAVYGIIALSGFLFFLLARNLRKIRLKNRILSLAGKDIKTVIGQQLQRRAAIDVIEQRYFDELPAQEKSDSINQIPNPGYDEREEETQ
ncbi:MAG: hypothetical protein ABI378_06250 [Chitinophagaceae bacterium]